MTTIAVLAAAAILLYTHRHALRNERQAWETRLTAQEQRHNAHFAKLLNHAAQERTLLHQAITQQTSLHAEQHAALLAQITAERDLAANERGQLLNRIKPETAQPFLASPEIVAPPAIPTEDDGAYWETADQLADRMWKAEVAAK
jgi:hypothetical protein